MRFTNQRRRQPPAVIIISLIDVMIVMLIFLMVTTTFKEHPAIKLVLPTSKDAQETVSDTLLVLTIPREGLYYVGREPVTSKRLRELLAQAVAKNPAVGVSIRADKATSVERLYDVIGAAKASGVQAAFELLTDRPK